MARVRGGKSKLFHMFLNDYSGYSRKNRLGQGTKVEGERPVTRFRLGNTKLESLATWVRVVFVSDENEILHGRAHEGIAGKELQSNDRIAWSSILRL